MSKIRGEVEPYTWNHRVVRREFPQAAHEEDRVIYEIHEAHYGKDKKRPEFISVEATPVCCTSIEGLRWTLEMMLKALDNPVLDHATLEEIEGQDV